MATGNEYGVDANGEAILLSSQGQQVMMQWEKDYMDQCVDALCIQPTDRVLEIGFGLAYSASRIQHFRPKCHTIIECDATVIIRANDFAREQDGTRVEIVDGTWQNMLPTLGHFDCVFFDDYPLPELENALSNIAFPYRRSRWHDFLDAVLHHVRPGARITGYLARQIDLECDGCHIVMNKMQVHVSSSCNYYPHQEAYIPVITVCDPTIAIASSIRQYTRDRVERVREQLIHQELLSLQDDAPSTGDIYTASQVGERIIESQPERPSSNTADFDAEYAGHVSRSAYLASLRSRVVQNKKMARLGNS